ncbi:MAG: helix-turn-helix domain-containing protein [Candidatus Nanopelagicaceae bacterium]|nr:helix-turn-helix domain-containing protein [Candidatus Nanopelagicaceae bacterium]
MGEKEVNLRVDADTNPSLGSSIRSRRRTLKLTQENLSDISGVSLRLVHEIEHGKEVVQLATLIKILSCLGLHLQLSIGAADAITIDPAIAALGRGKK